MSHPLLTKVLADWLRDGGYLLRDDVTPDQGAAEMEAQAERRGLADRLERALGPCDVCGSTWEKHLDTHEWRNDY